MTSLSSRYDAIVLGIGGMGSATAYHLARRGRKVLGLEQFSIPHELGSSHGLTRIIRLPYFEDPAYVPLLRRAFELWRALEQQAGEPLLYVTGSLDIGRPGSEVFEGSRRACKMYDLPHQILEGRALEDRFPAFQVPADMAAVFQPDGGFLVPESCIRSHARLAAASGADIHENEPALGWEPLAAGVRVQTARGVYEAERLVICAGAWSAKVVDRLAGLAVPERQVLAWFQPYRPELFEPKRLPVFILDTGPAAYYGFPMHGLPGLKIGRHHHLQQVADPDALDREVHPEDEQVLREFAQRYLPAGAGPTLATKTCMYTNTPDKHFILDRHPTYPQVAIAAGFSGHGFKFCSVVGEIMADLAENGTTQHPIGMFRFGRWS